MFWKHVEFTFVEQDCLFQWMMHTWMSSLSECRTAFAWPVLIFYLHVVALLLHANSHVSFTWQCSHMSSLQVTNDDADLRRAIEMSLRDSTSASASSTSGSAPQTTRSLYPSMKQETPPPPAVKKVISHWCLIIQMISILCVGCQKGPCYL